MFWMLWLLLYMYQAAYNTIIVKMLNTCTTVPFQCSKMKNNNFYIGQGNYY